MNYRVIYFLLIFSVNLLKIYGNVDQSDLNSLVSDSEKLLKTAVEGSDKGQFQLGSKDIFRSAINQASTAGGSTVTITQLDSITDVLHDAYLSFTKKRYGIQRPLISDNYWEIAADTSRWGSHNLHDPSIIKTKGYFYVYGTDAAWAQSVKGIPYRRSRDLVNWEYRGTVFGGYPAQNNKWLDSLTNISGHTQIGIWAPYILKAGNEYRLYYCSIHDGVTDASDGAVICLAVAPHPEGPWTQRGAVVYSVSSSSYNAIDPTVITGKDGKMWMIWGSWYKGLYVMELDPATGLKKTGASQTMIAKNRLGNWTSSMEGPEIIYNPEFNKYYLFIAEGNLGTIYHTRVARSDKPNGPFVDYSNNSVLYSTKKDIYPLISYPYQFKNHPGWQGVAHCSVINVNGTYFMLNQGRPTAIPSMMDMHVKKIYWTENGWPVISPERYANPGIMPEITSESIAGTWEEILLNEMKGTDGKSVDVPAESTDPNLFLCKPTILEFNTGGSITSGGTWTFDGKRMTIIKGSYTYKVSVDWGWDWENGCEALIYTGLRSDGKSFWGKKSNYLDIPSKNIVANSNFDKNLQGYVTTNYSGNAVTSITNASAGASNYINANTFKAQINAKAINYFDQSLCWRFPAQKGSRYKVSLKYRVSPMTPMHIELQETAKDFTALYRDSLSFVDANTFEFITNDVSITDPFYTLNIQYGYAPAGSKILLDNISITDITNQWDGNYIVNGGFECNLDSWTKYITTTATLKAAVIDSALISGSKSLMINNAVALSSTRLWNRLYWTAYLPGNFKYKVSFDTKGSGSLDAYFRLSTASSAAADNAGLYSVPVTSETTTHSFDIPVFASNGQYTLSFSPRDAGSFLLDNVRLEMIADTITDIRNPKTNSLGNIGITPNPTSGIVNIPSSFIGNDFELIDLQGQKRFEIQLSSTRVDLSRLSEGLYLARIKTDNGYYVEKISIIR